MYFWKCASAFVIGLALVLVSKTERVFGNASPPRENPTNSFEGNEKDFLDFGSNIQPGPTPSGAFEEEERMITSEPCPIGHFACANHSGFCIVQAKTCDGEENCPDGTDEMDCLNPHDPTYWDKMFKPRPDKDLDLYPDEICKYNITTSTTTWAHDDYVIGNPEIQSPTNDAMTEEGSVFTVFTGESCHCIWEKFICHNLHLENLSIVPSDVIDLDLSGSRVGSLDFNSPGFPHLRYLILSSCGILHVPFGAFYKLEGLEILHLTDNQLSSIVNATFSTNVNLLKLFLGHNKISTLEPGAFKDLSSLLELDLRNNSLVEISSDVFQPLQSLRILDLSHNKIIEVKSTSFTSLNSLEELSLTGNEINIIQRSAFEHMSALKSLYLSRNKLKTLRAQVFCNLNSLLDLRLDYNELQGIEPGTFICLESLESLNLAKNRILELDHAQDIFKQLAKLKHLQFDRFWMCGWAPHVRSCHPKSDGISSDKNLLDNVVLRTCVWIMGLVGVIGNLFVIVSRLVLREPNRIHSFYIKNLALADLLMGMFLLSIAIHDQKFRGTFSKHQHSWRNSVTCKLSGLLGTWSSEASVVMLAVITLDRYLSIIRPFADKGVSLVPAIFIIASLWSLSLFVSYLPMSGLAENYFGHEFYSSNGLCLPLQIHNPFDPGWEYSFVLFVVLNSMAFAFITYAYYRVFQTIQNSALRLRSNQQKQDGILAKRFGLVVLTNFLCWAPIIACKCLAMIGVSIHSDLYAWLAVFALPLNSATNPIIYSLSAKLYMQQLSKAAARARKRWARRKASEDSSISLSLFNRARLPRQPTMTTTIQTSLRASKLGNPKPDFHALVCTEPNPRRSLIPPEV